MICLDKCRAEGMKHEGLGGQILVFKKAGIKYVVKVNEQAQSINEYVAQHLLKALGFDDVPVELVEYGGRIFGATIFQERITRIYPANPASVPDAIKQNVLELYILNSILNNADEGEFYSQGDKVISLDYGEALIPTFWLNFAIFGSTDAVSYNIDVVSSVDRATTILSRLYESQMCETALENIFNRFERFDIDNLRECFSCLDNALFNGFSMIHCNYILRIKESIKEQMMTMER